MEVIVTDLFVLRGVKMSVCPWSRTRTAVGFLPWRGGWGLVLSSATDVRASSSVSFTETAFLSSFSAVQHPSSWCCLSSTSQHRRGHLLQQSDKTCFRQILDILQPLSLLRRSWFLLSSPICHTVVNPFICRSKSPSSSHHQLRLAAGGTWISKRTLASAWSWRCSSSTKPQAPVFSLLSIPRRIASLSENFCMFHLHNHNPKITQTESTKMPCSLNESSGIYLSICAGGRVKGGNKSEPNWCSDPLLIYHLLVYIAKLHSELTNSKW